MRSQHDRDNDVCAHAKAIELVAAIPADHPLHEAALVLLADTTSALAAVA